MAASSLALAGDCIRSPMSSVGGPGVHVLPVFSRDESVEREVAGAEAEDHHSSKEERIGVGFVELLRVAEDGEKSVVLSSPKGDKHRSGKKECDGAREESENEQDASEELKPRDEVRVESRERDVQRGEEVDDFRLITQLSQAGLYELPAPVDAHEQQQRRTEFFS